MIVTERHPIDGILADLGTLVRRVRAGSLNEQSYLAITHRIRAELIATAADPDGLIARRFDLLEHAEEAGSLTRRLFEETATLIRTTLQERRSQPMTVVRNFAAMPVGNHGRRLPHLTVIDGGLSHQTTPQLGA